MSCTKKIPADAGESGAGIGLVDPGHDRRHAQGECRLRLQRGDLPVLYDVKPDEVSARCSRSSGADSAVGAGGGRGVGGRLRSSTLLPATRCSPSSAAPTHAGAGARAARATAPGRSAAGAVRPVHLPRRHRRLRALDLHAPPRHQENRRAAAEHARSWRRPAIVIAIVVGLALGLLAAVWHTCLDRPHARCWSRSRRVDAEFWLGLR